MLILLFSFCPEEMGKEYKYLKNMFYLYQVRSRALCWIRRVREARLILLLDDDEMIIPSAPQKIIPSAPQHPCT